MTKETREPGLFPHPGTSRVLERNWDLMEYTRSNNAKCCAQHPITNSNFLSIHIRKVGKAEEMCVGAQGASRRARLASPRARKTPARRAKMDPPCVWYKIQHFSNCPLTAQVLGGTVSDVPSLGSPTEPAQGSRKTSLARKELQAQRLGTGGGPRRPHARPTSRSTCAKPFVRPSRSVPSSCRSALASSSCRPRSREAKRRITLEPFS